MKKTLAVIGIILALTSYIAVVIASLNVLAVMGLTLIALLVLGLTSKIVMMVIEQKQSLGGDAIE